MPVKAYSYIRISTTEQRKGRGEERQLEAAQKYAAEHGLELDDSHRDLGRSGYHGDHVKTGHLGRFLELVATGQIAVGSYLLVENFDRLSRQAPIDAQAQFIAILQAGIKVVTLMDGQIYERGRDFTQMIISLTIMSRGHEESARKSFNSKNNADALRKDMLAGLPRFMPQCVGWIDQTIIPGSKDCRFALNDHAKSVHRIFELADQGVGALSIARILNEEGRPPLKAIGTKWWENTVIRILKNEVAIGTLQVNDVLEGKHVPMGEPIKNYYPAAVSEELFWRVQRRKQKPAPTGSKGMKYANLFPTITRCVHCGGGLALVQSTKFDYKYYRCKRRYEDKTCSGPKSLFPYNALEVTILDNVTDFYRDASLTQKTGTTPREELLSTIASLEGDLAAFEKRRKNTLAMAQMVETDEDRADLQVTLRELRPQIDQARAQLNERQSELAEIDDKKAKVQDVVDMIANERASWKSGSDDEVFVSRSSVSQAIRNFVSQIVVDFNMQTALVYVGGYTRFYQFDRSGTLLGTFNNTNMPVEKIETLMREDGVSEDGIAQAKAAYAKIKAAG